MPWIGCILHFDPAQFRYWSKRWHTGLRAG